MAAVSLAQTFTTHARAAGDRKVERTQRSMNIDKQAQEGRQSAFFSCLTV